MEFSDIQKDLKYNYTPLPEFLELKQSPIHGNGIFTNKDITKGMFIGISHVPDDRGFFDNNLIRTPLSGFTNHSTTPNMTMEWDKLNSFYYFKASKTIKEGEELTVDYSVTPCVNKN